MKSPLILANINVQVKENACWVHQDRNHELISDLLKYFNKQQLKITLDFLIYCIDKNLHHDEIAESIANIQLIREYLKDMILKKLKEIFPEYEITTERTLLECDFYDTHYGYFDEIDDNYLTAINMSAEDLVLKYGFDWPESYLKIGLEAAKSRSRPHEGIKTWKDVTYEYLYYFGQSCSFLGSDGFKFFLPAALFHYLARPDRNNSFMESFVFRLDMQWAEDSNFFNDLQKKFIINFLKEHFDGDVQWASLY